MPVPDDTTPVEPDVVLAVRVEAALAGRRADLFVKMKELAAVDGDLSSAWVCEINRVEEADAARELAALADSLEGR